MRKGILAASLVALFVLSVALITTDSDAKGRPDGMIWSSCTAYRTLGTKATFKPDHGNFDELYTGGSFRDGIGSISESAPGDVGFNGGRWHVNTLKEGVAEDKYSDACSVEDLDLNDFESTDTYFECPLLPQHMN